jgi:hypothetical protein
MCSCSIILNTHFHNLEIGKHIKNAINNSSKGVAPKFEAPKEEPFKPIEGVFEGRLIFTIKN